MTDAEIDIKCGINKLKSVNLQNPSDAVKTARELFDKTMNSIEQTVGHQRFLTRSGPASTSTKDRFKK